jgi:hypothetical protein
VSVIVQYTVKPNPGGDLGAIVELAKESAANWRKYGGKVSFWTVSVGEVGNYVFAVSFENLAAYGAAADKMASDPAVRAWQAKRLKAGHASWVRANLANEIEI